jgi:GNAT superfamily N-acetyltransferase
VIHFDETTEFEPVRNATMKRRYVVPLGQGLKAEALLVRCVGGMMLSSIVVPRELRGHWHGTALLRTVLADADRCGVRLFLHAVSFGAITDAELEAWYKRHGFVWKNCLMFEREPIAVGETNGG